MNMLVHTDADDIQVAPDLSRQIATLRALASIIGDSATTQDEIDVARDLIDILKFLKHLDGGLH